VKVFENYSRYEVSAEGGVFNRETGQWLEGSTNPDGYVHYRLTDDSGKATTIGRHRLVAMYHHGPAPQARSIVNHCNGIKGDDRHDNLEWTTYQGNAEHAGANGLTEKCYPITTRNVVTGELIHYPSAISAARSLGLSKDAVLWRLKGGEERVYPEGLQYRHRDDHRPWVGDQQMQYGRSQAVLLRDVKTDQVIRFDKQSDVASYLGVSGATVSTWISSSDQRLINGTYQIKLELDSTPWREVCDPYRESGHKRAVVVTDASGQETVYLSAKECADAMGLKPTTLNERLKSNGDKAFKDGFRYRYY
jgi:hypothetical protein